MKDAAEAAEAAEELCASCLARDADDDAADDAAAAALVDRKKRDAAADAAELARLAPYAQAARDGAGDAAQSFLRAVAACEMHGAAARRQLEDDVRAAADAALASGAAVHSADACPCDVVLRVLGSLEHRWAAEALCAHGAAAHPSHDPWDCEYDSFYERCVGECASHGIDLRAAIAAGVAATSAALQAEDAASEAAHEVVRASVAGLAAELRTRDAAKNAAAIAAAADVPALPEGWRTAADAAGAARAIAARTGRRAPAELGALMYMCDMAWADAEALRRRAEAASAHAHWADDHWEPPMRLLPPPRSRQHGPCYARAATAAASAAPNAPLSHEDDVAAFVQDVQGGAALAALVDAVAWLTRDATAAELQALVTHHNAAWLASRPHERLSRYALCTWKSAIVRTRDEAEPSVRGQWLRVLQARWPPSLPPWATVNN